MRDEMARSKTRLEINIPGTNRAGEAVLHRISAARSRREGGRSAIRHVAEQQAHTSALYGRRGARRKLQARQFEFYRRRRIPRIHRVDGFGRHRSRLRLAAAGFVDRDGSGVQGSGRDVFAQAGVSEQPGAAVGHRRFFEGAAGEDCRATGNAGLDGSQLG